MCTKKHGVVQALRFALVALLLGLCGGRVWAQATPPYTVQIPRAVTAILLPDPDDAAAKPKWQIKFDPILDPATPPAARDALIAHLSNKANYTFQAGWPKIDGRNLEEIRTPNAPFSLERVRPTLDLPSIKINLIGMTPTRSRGIVAIKSLADWKFVEQEAPTKTVTSFLYAASPAVKLKGFTSDPVRLSAGEQETYALEYRGEGVLKQFTPDSVQNARKPLILGEALIKLPLTEPGDTKDKAGADKDASRAIADVVQLGVKALGFKRGSGLYELGVRARASGSLKGSEVVGYFSPFTQLSADKRAFYALEVEAGWRQGDAEWKNLTTRAADTGNTVGRLGAVLEYAPPIGATGINRNLSPAAAGLKLYVRDRFWLDTFNDSFDTRGRNYFDSELFYNFTGESRIYVRYETGQLPPDLSSYVRRFSVGVGKAF